MIGKRCRFNLIIHFIIILSIMILACNNINSSIEIEKYELSRCISDVPIRNVTKIKRNPGLGVNNIYGKNFTEEDKYLLAKIAMAEGENQNIQTKTLIIMTVMNRVESSDFPDSISEVIFQNNNGVYEFSPVMPRGRWYDVEPDEKCYEALEVVLTTKYDYSGNALYFESCEEADNWHSKNLTYLYQSEDLRFYK